MTSQSRKPPAGWLRRIRKEPAPSKPKPRTVPELDSGLEPGNESTPIPEEMPELENEYEQINDKSLEDVEWSVWKNFIFF